MIHLYPESFLVLGDVEEASRVRLWFLIPAGVLCCRMLGDCIIVSGKLVAFTGVEDINMLE